MFLLDSILFALAGAATVLAVVCLTGAVLATIDAARIIRGDR